MRLDSVSDIKSFQNLSLKKNHFETNHQKSWGLPAIRDKNQRNPYEVELLYLQMLFSLTVGALIFRILQAFLPLAS